MENKIEDSEKTFVDYNKGFILLSKVEQTNLYISKELINYPKFYVVLRNQIELTMFQIIESIHSYRINTNKRIKEKNLNDIVLKLSMLDYYMKYSYENKIINQHKYCVIGNFLVEIRKITYGILRNEK